MSKYLKIFLLLFLLAPFLFGQGQQKPELPEDELIARGVEIRLEAFRERKMRDCRQKAIERASVMADSLIRIRVLEQKGLTDPSGRPLKPEKPEFKKRQDSLQLKPFFEK